MAVACSTHGWETHPTKRPGGAAREIPAAVEVTAQEGSAPAAWDTRAHHGGGLVLRSKPKHLLG